MQRDELERIYASTFLELLIQDIDLAAKVLSELSPEALRQALRLSEELSLLLRAAIHQYPDFPE